MALYTITQVDYSNENTSTSFNMADAATSVERDALQDAIEAVSIGNIWKDTFSLIERLSRVAPSNSDAQRERKILLRCQDSVNFKPVTITIGCADVSVLTIVPNSDQITLDDGSVMADLVTAVEANALSNSGNALEVLEARLVGRNT